MPGRRAAFLRWHAACGVDPETRPNYKTALCWNWQTHGRCRRERCDFAHGEQERLHWQQWRRHNVRTEAETLEKLLERVLTDEPDLGFSES